MSKRPTKSGGSAGDDFDGEDLTAAEYALGILDHEARLAAETRAERDEPFAKDILAWVKRFEPLIDGVASVEPSVPLWPRIEASIDRPRGQTAQPPLPTPPLPTPANDVAPQGLTLWRAWAVGASAVAAAAILFIAVRPMLSGTGAGQHAAIFASNGHAGHTLIATLALTESKASAFTVAYDPAQSVLYATPAGDFSIPRARSAELWLIPADGKPRPIGVVDASKAATVPMPPAFKSLAQEKATLAISIEPPGGSTTGLPTGPVVAAGKFTTV